MLMSIFSMHNYSIFLCLIELSPATKNTKRDCCTIASKINVTPCLQNSNPCLQNYPLPIITKFKFVTAVKYYYRVLQLTAVFLTPLGVTFILPAMVQPCTLYGTAGKG